MTTLSRVTTCIYNIKALRMLGKCHSPPRVLKSQFFNCSNFSSCAPGLLKGVHQHFLLSKRSSSSQKQSKRYPELTDFPVYVWPNLLNSIKNRLLSSLVISRYFDEEFDLDEFVEDSKKAVERITQCLAESNLLELDGLVTQDVIDKIKDNIRNFSLKQRMELEVDKRDIFACYVHNVGILMPNRSGSSTVFQGLPNDRCVEITMTYHVLKGYKDYKDTDEFQQSPLGVLSIPDFEKNLHVLNYRFIRDYSLGLQSHWIINALNHFKPLEKWQ